MKGIFKHISDVISTHQLHVPCGEDPLADLLVRAEYGHLLVAAVCLNAVDQLQHISFGALNPLKKYATAKYEYAGNAQRRVKPACRSDNSVDVCLINAVAYLTAIDKIEKQLLFKGTIGLISTCWGDIFRHDCTLLR